MEFIFLGTYLIGFITMITDFQRGLGIIGLAIGLHSILSAEKSDKVFNQILTKIDIITQAIEKEQKEIEHKNKSNENTNNNSISIKIFGL